MTGSARPMLVLSALLVLIVAGWAVFGARQETQAVSGGVQFVERREAQPTIVPAGPNAASAAPPAASAPVAAPLTVRHDGEEDIGAMLPPAADEPRAMHDRLRREVRDAEWAPRTEAAVKGAYVGIPYVGTTADPLRIRCGTSVCEAAGTLPEGLSMANLNVAMEQLQAKALSERLAAQGVDVKSIAFHGGEGKQTFVTYLARK